MTEAPTFFTSQDDLRDWLAENQAKASSLWVGFHKTKSEAKGVTYAQALDVSLCYGWIDGVRKSIDETRWMIRFSPRKSRSIWSAVNLKRYAELEELGLIQEAGRKVFSGRNPSDTQKYSYEQANARLTEEHKLIFKERPAAWEFFSRQPPGYRKIASWWIVSAKQEETRLRRLTKLIECSERSERLPEALYPSKKIGDIAPTR